MLQFRDEEGEGEGEEEGSNCLILEIEFVGREAGSKRGGWRGCAVEGGGGEACSGCGFRGD
jgi:hypothetical protein